MVDTLITLFESTATTYTTNGLGGLPDAVRCVVVEERNGSFELEMEYPIDGIRYSELTLRRIIYCKPNSFDSKQPFRIYSISKPLNGIVTINAAHISYDLSGIPVRPIGECHSAGDAFVQLGASSVTSNPFLFNTDVTKAGTFSTAVPKSIRNLLGGEEGSILDIYGGEYEFDKYTVFLHNNRGSDRGVTIRYGKNLTDLNQEENCSELFTGVYPYYYTEGDGLVEVDGRIVNVNGTYNFTKILPLDLSSEFDEKPDKSDLLAKAKEYITNNNIGVPKVNLKVSFVQLAQSEEYSNIALLETVKLCDDVGVYFEELGVTNSKAKCVKTEYDVLTDKYNSIELGEARTNLANTISSQSDKIDQQPTKSYMDHAIDHATQLVTGGLGGYVVMHNSSGAKGGFPDEILVLDEDSEGKISKATRVWRWNQNGFGYSSTGYDGEYGTAITMDGAIVANFITVGTMLANIIRGGTLALGGNMVGVDGVVVNLGNGAIEMYDDAGNKIGYWNKNGMYVAGNADITGRIDSSSGYIAGFEIYGDHLRGYQGARHGSSTSKSKYNIDISLSSNQCIAVQKKDDDDEIAYMGVDDNGNGVLYADYITADEKLYVDGMDIKYEIEQLKKKVN